MAKYKSYNEGQQYFEVINLEKELPPDNRARIIKEIVCSIDISSFDRNYNNDTRGAKAKHVRMMLGILLLSFVRNIIGSRSIVSQLANDLEFKYILEGCKIPDDSTIRLFRRRHLVELGKIFSQTVHIGSSLGMNDFGALAIDGTKIQAYASLYETKDKKGLEKSIGLLANQMEKTIERLNSSEDKSEEDELKKRLKNIEKRDQVLKEFREILSEKDEDEKVNRVDPDARLMRKSDGKPIIGYNAQAGVDCGEHGLIMSAEVYQDATDEKLLEKMRDSAEAEAGEEYDVTLADAGYITYETMSTASNERRDILGPDRLYEKDLYNTHKKNGYAKSDFNYDNEEDIYTCPAGNRLEFQRMTKGKTSDLLYVYYNREACSRCKYASACLSKNSKYRTIYRDYRELLREKMRDRLNTNEGYLLYGKRSQNVEPVFGDMKQNKGRRQFYYRGVEKVRTEWKLLCAGVNLNKIIQFLEGKDWQVLLKKALSQ